MEKRLGKIENIKFGHGGYQDSQLGIGFTLTGNSWGVEDGRWEWDAYRIECTEHCKWTEKNRSSNYDEIMRYISKLLNEAKVNNITELKGVPIEVTFDGNLLIKWRILTEVL